MLTKDIGRIVQVWFPDSAHKTAQAIADFDAEDLPLLIFANWRGFSGGQRDMFDEVLKFGARIVDGLVAFKRPVFVYIPPLAELRGGAWVVVDPTINPSVMEMYAAEDARGGVLEPGGLVEIKFREKDLKALMHRLDEKLLVLDAQLQEARRDADSGREASLRNKVDDREKHLLPVYTSVAVHFADLHDAPPRMKSKKAIRDVVPWSNARRFFYWRLRRKIAEFELCSPDYHALYDGLSREYAAILSAQGLEAWGELEDRAALELLESHAELAHSAKRQVASKKLAEDLVQSILTQRDPAGFVHQALSQLHDPDQKIKLQSALRAALDA